MYKARRNDSRESAASRDSHLTPVQRLQALKTYGHALQIDNNEKVSSYYDSSTAMIRKADRQYADGELENALVSYLKFVDLFRNKIVHHVDYKLVSVSARAANQYYQGHAQKRARDISAELLKRYKQLTFAHQMEDERRDEIGRSESRLARGTSSRTCLTKSRSVFHSPPTDGACDPDTAMLRTVVLPKQLSTVFQIVTQRLRKGALTVWGVLAGRPEDGEYAVTHLIVPPEFDETVMSCSVRHNPCLEYAEQQGLVVLGWIHTHGPASCYMSGTDMHIQWHFQDRLPEAISVVCSPRYTQVEHYNLLRSGMEYLGNCKIAGAHAHQASHPLYANARHVRVVLDRTFKLLDLSGPHEEVH